jgi:hypothetical protein
MASKSPALKSWELVGSPILVPLSTQICAAWGKVSEGAMIELVG